MEAVQWIVAAITSALVLLVAFLQWRTAQQKAVLDLFEKRFKIYEVVKSCVDQMRTNPEDFGNERRRGNSSGSATKLLSSLEMMFRSILSA